MLRAFGDEEAQITQVVAGWAGSNGIADRGEKWTGIEFSERLLGIEAEGPSAGNCGGIGDGAGRSRVAVDAIGAGAENGETLAGMVGELKSACQRKLLVA